MNKLSYRYYLRLFVGLMLSFSLFGLTYAGQTLPKHYPQNFDVDGYVTSVNIKSQTINISGYPYGMRLDTTAYGLNGTKISLLSLTSKTKVGIQLFPYVKDQTRAVSKIWVLPSDYELESRPL